MNDKYPEHFRTAVASSLNQRGVNIIYNDRVIDNIKEGASSVTTRNGKTLVADLIISTHVGGPNTAFTSSLGPDALDKWGYIVVKPTLQLPGHSNIYAAGDAIAWPEAKNASKIQQQKGVVVANIISAIQGKTPAAVYNGGIELIVVTNGKVFVIRLALALVHNSESSFGFQYSGAGYINILWGITFGAWLSSLIKSRNLAIPMARKTVGLS